MDYVRSLVSRPDQPSNEKYSSVPTDENEVPSFKEHKPSPARRWTHFWTRRRIIMAGVLAFFSIQILLAMNWNPDVTFPYSVPTNITSDKERMHILIPANNGNFELCKLMLSLSILGYNTPHLVNWGLDFSNDASHPFDMAGGSHLGKVSGVIKWLWSLGPDQMSDIVLILDAYDVQFQLPPEVLLNQYYRSNREWNEIRAKKPGMRRAMRDRGLYQTVIFAADKKCSPHKWDEPWCYLQPKSPLPDDLYGNRTDTSSGWDYDLSQAQRPRWVNSGVVMGPAGDLLDIFMRAYQQMEKERFGSDQSLFNLVFGEQEYMREYWRQQSRQWFEVGPSTRVADWVPKRLKKRAETIEPTTPGMAGMAAADAKQDAAEKAEAIAADPVAAKPKPAPQKDPWDLLTDEEKTVAVISPFSKDHHKMEPAFDRPRTEYHMGLDYWSRLSKTDKSSFYEVRKYTFNTTPPTGNLTRDWRDCQTPDPVLHPDLVSGLAPPPFPADFPAPAGHPPPPKSWADCPLWTDICAETVPVAVHHNGFKIWREYHWTQMWYHRYARAFIEYRTSQAAAAEAAAEEARNAGYTVVDAWNGRDGTPAMVQHEGELAGQKVYKMQDVNVANAYTPGGRKLTMDDVCGKDINMVFHGCMWGNGWDCERELAQQKEKADKAAAEKAAKEKELLVAAEDAADTR